MTPLDALNARLASAQAQLTGAQETYQRTVVQAMHTRDQQVGQFTLQVAQLENAITFVTAHPNEAAQVLQALGIAV